MNDNIIKELSYNLNIGIASIKNTLKLLEDGSTIPFIARYRKEATKGLDETQIKEISDRYNYELNLLKRKEDVIRLIKEKDMLTDELEAKIMKCEKLVEIEDLYRPYKEKKLTKGVIAEGNGLLPLAKIIMSFPDKKPLDIADTFNCKLEDNNQKLEGAFNIIREFISDNPYYSKYIRNYIFKTGKINTSKVKNSIDTNKVYEMYYDFTESIKYAKGYRVLAINRGEKEKILKVKFDYNFDEIYSYIRSKVIKNDKSPCVSFVEDALKDSLKKLIIPRIEREIRKELTDEADVLAIKNFSENLHNLLMTPPVKDVTVLGFDPAFRTGCKLAVLSPTGNVEKIGVIYPHEPQNEKEKSKKIVLDLINKYNIDIIAIGNGTASRESEAFISNVIKGTNVKYVIVNEAGASVYSASSLAKEEFPGLNVSERSAISIGRRLQDPLSELVKITPESIGVGMYQHDVNSKDLKNSLSFVVENVVNSVGVNINTASRSILSYVSGLTKSSIDKILNKRDIIGKFKDRNEIEGVLSKKAYEQSIGFMRIIDGLNPLDKTSIHPESYDYAYKILDKLNLKVTDIGKDNIADKLESLNYDELDFEIDKYTFDDIIKALKKPILDPRDEVVAPILKSDILTIDDLKSGMMLEGTVRNVVDFGLFVDIGLKNDGLIHISEMSNSFVKHPSDLFKVGDIIKCYVKDIDKDKKRVSLTLKN